MNLIVAVDENWGIGKDGGLLTHLPGDMKYFRETTKGHVVVMGRKTLESFPDGKPLKNRTNVVLTAALLPFASHALRIYMACILIFGIQMACQMTFTAIGCAKASIMVAATRKFILLLPLIYIMPHIFTSDPTTAVYMAEPVADFFAVTFTALLFRSEFKKALAKLES